MSETTPEGTILLNHEKRLDKLEKLCKELKRLANISVEGEAELYEHEN